MKVIRFFAGRKGLPVPDFDCRPRYLHLPLLRPWLMLGSCLLWATLTGAFGALAWWLAVMFEAMLLPVFPKPHALGVAALCIPVAGTWAVTWMLRKYPGAGVYAQIILVAAGMPVGLEGTALHLSRIAGAGKHFTGAEKELLVACGMVGGFAGVFGAPLAAIAFACTFISHRKLLYWTSAAVCGKAMHLLLSGATPLPFSISGVQSHALGLYLLVGVVAALVAVIMVRGIQVMRRATAWGRFGWWPVVAAAVAGLIAWQKPDAYGQGFARTELMLAVNGITIALLVAMSFYRMVAFCTAMGAGVKGSVIYPLLTIGAAWGLLSALLLQLCFPDIAVHPPKAALVGAAALIAGATRGWIFAALLMLEVSGNGDAWLPVALAALTAYLVSAVFLSRCTVAQYGTS